MELMYLSNTYIYIWVFFNKSIAWVVWCNTLWRVESEVDVNVSEILNMSSYTEAF